MIPGKRLVQAGIAALAGAAYLWLGHRVSASASPPTLGIVVGLAPLIASLVALFWTSRFRRTGLLACLIACIVLALHIEQLKQNAAWIYFVQHAGINAMLGIVFGRTLGGKPDEALCSRIAILLLRRTPDADYLRYTWRVTLVWTVYFGLTASLSVMLFLFGPIEVWSVFANLLMAPLLGVMFLGEYLIRIRAFPGQNHFGIAAVIQAYRDYSRHGADPEA